MQIARVSPVHREYLPTLGPLDYPESRGFAAGTADVDVTARATALKAVLAACRGAKVTSAGLSPAGASALRRQPRTATGAIFNRAKPHSASPLAARTVPAPATTRASTSIWRVSTPGTSPNRLSARPCDRDSPSRSSPASIPSSSSRRRSGDLIGFLTNSFDARTADEGRSAFSAEGRQVATRREAVQRPDQFVQRSDASRDCRWRRAPAKAFPPRRVSLIKAGVLENLAYSRFWAQERKVTPTPGPVNY